MISNILSAIEALLIFAWMIGCCCFSANGFIHILLLAAVLIIAIRELWCKIIV